jgi:hypothetical protein
MIYSAEVKSKGTIDNTWIINPIYTRIDGKPAPAIVALSADGIVPQVKDIVLCAESINDIEHNSVKSFDDNRGANPIIIGVFSQLMTTNCDLTVQGKLTLGTGSKKMIRGEDLKVWAQNVDAAIQALYAWGKTVDAPPFPGLPAYSQWSDTALSQNHKLD